MSKQIQQIELCTLQMLYDLRAITYAETDEDKIMTWQNFKESADKVKSMLDDYIKAVEQ